MVIETRQAESRTRITAINVPQKTASVTLQVELTSSTPWANASPIRTADVLDATEQVASPSARSAE